MISPCMVRSVDNQTNFLAPEFTTLLMKGKLEQYYNYCFLKYRSYKFSILTVHILLFEQVYGKHRLYASIRFGLSSELRLKNKNSFHYKNQTKEFNQVALFVLLGSYVKLSQSCYNFFLLNIGCFLIRILVQYLRRFFHCIFWRTHHRANKCQVPQEKKSE